MRGFVGAKGGAGVYQRIICWLPPHGCYIEPFAGTAALAGSYPDEFGEAAGVLDGQVGPVPGDQHGAMVTIRDAEVGRRPATPGMMVDRPATASSRSADGGSL